jgi:hypothetical protein
MFQLSRAAHKEKIKIDEKEYLVFYFSYKHFDPKIKVTGRASTENFKLDTRFMGSNQIQCMRRAIYSSQYFDNVLVVLSPEMNHFDRLTGFSPATAPLK